MKTAIHPLTVASLSRLSAIKPKHPLKGRGFRRVDIPKELSRAWQFIPDSHKSEVGEKVCGGFKFRKVVSLEAGRKLGLKIPRGKTRLASRFFLIRPVCGEPLARKFSTEKAGHEFAQSRGLAYSIVKIG